MLRRRRDGTLTPKEEAAAQRWAREFASGAYLMELDAQVLDRAKQPFKVESVRTLDALHARLIPRSP